MPARCSGAGQGFQQRFSLCQQNLQITRFTSQIEEADHFVELLQLSLGFCSSIIPQIFPQQTFLFRILNAFYQPFEADGAASAAPMPGATAPNNLSIACISTGARSSMAMRVIFSHPFCSMDPYCAWSNVEKASLFRDAFSAG